MIANLLIAAELGAGRIGILLESDDHLYLDQSHLCHRFTFRSDTKQSTEMGSKFSKSSRDKEDKKWNDFKIKAKLPERLDKYSTLPASFRRRHAEPQVEDGKTGTLPRNLNRNESFSKRFRKSIKSWASQKGLVEVNRTGRNEIEPRSEESTKPSSLILANENDIEKVADVGQLDEKESKKVDSSPQQTEVVVEISSPLNVNDYEDEHKQIEDDSKLEGNSIIGVPESIVEESDVKDVQPADIHEVNEHNPLLESSAKNMDKILQTAAEDDQNLEMEKRATELSDEIMSEVETILTQKQGPLEEGVLLVIEGNQSSEIVQDQEIEEPRIKEGEVHDGKEKLPSIQSTISTDIPDKSQAAVQDVLGQDENQENAKIVEKDKSLNILYDKDQLQDDKIELGVPPVHDKIVEDVPLVDNKIAQDVDDKIPKDLPPVDDKILHDVAPVDDKTALDVPLVYDKIPQDVPLVYDEILHDVPLVNDEIPQDVPPFDDEIPQDVHPVDDKILQQDVSPVDDKIAHDVPPVDDNISQDVPPVEDKISQAPVDDNTRQDVPPVEDKIAQDDPPIEDKIAHDVPPIDDKITHDFPPIDDKIAQDVNPVEEMISEDVLPYDDKIAEGVQGDQYAINVVVEKITGDDQKSEDVSVVHVTDEEKVNIKIESITPTLAKDMAEIEADNAELTTKVDIAEEGEETEETGGKAEFSKEFINRENEEEEKDEKCESIDLENGKEYSEYNINYEIKDQANIQAIDIEKEETSEQADANADGTIEENYGGERENDELSKQRSNLISSDVQQKNCPDLSDPIWKHNWNLACLAGDQQNHGAFSDVRDIIADIVCTATAGNAIRIEESIEYFPNNEVNSYCVFEPSEKEIESLNCKEVEKLEEKFEETFEIDGLNNGKVEEKEDTSKGTQEDIKDDKDIEENSEKLEVVPEKVANFSTEKVESYEKGSEHDTGDGIFITENIEDLDVNVAEAVQTMEFKERDIAEFISSIDETKEGIE